MPTPAPGMLRVTADRRYRRGWVLLTHPPSHSGTAEPIVEGVTGTGGGITLSIELWRATIANALVEDISAYLYAGEVSYNSDRAIKHEGIFHLRDASVVSPYADYLAVFMNRAYDDGTTAERDQLGLYATKAPPGTRTLERAEGIYTGADLTSVLARYAFDDAYNVAASTNYVTAVTTIMALAGVTRYVLPATTETTASIISFPVGTTYLEACNTLLEAIGYYHLAMTKDGRLTSQPSRNVQYVEPYRTLTDTDLYAPVQTQPTDTTVANVVIVIQDNPNAAALTKTVRNDDTSSPTGTPVIGERTRVEKRSDLATQAAVDALATRLLSEGRTFYQTATLTVLPDPDAMTPHQTVDLDLTGELEIFNGRWWVRTARIGLTPATAGTVIEANRVTDTIEGTLI